MQGGVFGKDMSLQGCSPSAITFICCLLQGYHAVGGVHTAFPTPCDTGDRISRQRCKVVGAGRPRRWAFGGSARPGRA